MTDCHYETLEKLCQITEYASNNTCNFKTVQTTTQSKLIQTATIISLTKQSN